jgi:DNA adenine methylase
LQDVLILNRPALAVIEQFDGPDALFYCDPPYLHQTRAAVDVYDFMMTAEDRRRLLAVLRSCRGKVMLSGYPSALYDECLHDWGRHAFDKPNNAAGGAAKARMAEVRRVQRKVQATFDTAAQANFWLNEQLEAR